ncbi:duplicated homeodomain-like superfamily protein [Striga asiatica]|uniref:Duplicated homeodomain-like superfamily protein n=1 Tax=Striga asiatica TaxID=4170 RepID=A0A5A7P647_STRAF|nr:duplicated homeodomain-like superfamily protein [Striga asiatica]
MRWGEMEILSPTNYLTNTTGWPPAGADEVRWTPAENKAFENALALFDDNTPDRWHKVAAMVPTKTVLDVIRHYKELEDDVTSIEAGLVPVPGYSCHVSSPQYFTLEYLGGPHHHHPPYPFPFNQSSRKSPAVRLPTAEHERKKGIPWTEEEHKLFLMGLKKYGKGDWRNISRNFVMTRTPTQVASHAQKYFIRQLSGGKDKRRASIHDITTVSLNENHQTSSDEKKQLMMMTSAGFQTSNETGRNVFTTYGVDSYVLGSQDSMFQGFHYPDE